MFVGAVLSAFAVGRAEMLRSGAVKYTAPHIESVAASVARNDNVDAPRTARSTMLTSPAPAAAASPSIALAMMHDEPAAELPATSRFTVDIGVDWTNAYYFRGVFQEDSGSIFQPAVEVSYALSDTVTLYAGMWNSIHGAATGSGTSDNLREHWYECDLYGGVRASLDRWTLSTAFIAYLSPSDAFDTATEIELAAGYDDSDCWNGTFALNPEVRLGIELSGAADGHHSGVYLQLGVAPAFECPISGSHALTISLPVTLGLSLNDYYEDAEGDDHTFGNFDVGVEAAYALPNEFAGGAWTISGGMHVLFLDGATREINGGDRDEFIARLGISASF